MTEEDIKLFEHNETAYKKLCKSLDEYPLSFIEHATGTGKSFIILKYLYVMMRKKRIFFVSLHEEMFDQLFGKQMKTLGISKDDFKKFNTLIYYNLINANPKELVDNYDCFVFDEAHHCGAPKWSKVVSEIKDEVLKRNDKKMIGLTATGIRYLDNYLDVAEEYFDGHVASRLGVAEAMLKALLPAPLYVNSIESCKNKYYHVLAKAKKLPRTNEVMDIINRIEDIGKNIKDKSSIADLLKQYDVKPGEKYIVFCKDLNDLRLKKEQAKDWFKDIGDVKTFEAHSAQKKQRNHEQIQEFEKNRDEVSLMFAVDIFNEGFHIDDLDGILMFRKTKSPIIYLQQIGRVLSLSTDKKQVKIFDFVDNISDNDVIRELYKELVSEAKRLVKDNPNNKGLYEEIIERFKIVDNTSTTIENLEAVEDYLDENFTFRNSITRALALLQQYRDTYPNSDIQKDIKYGILETEYLRAYKHIIAMDKYLTLDNIALLNKLNIDFNGEIITDIEKRKEMLHGYDSFALVESSEYDSFRRAYVEFVHKYNRRPRLGNTNEEDILYDKYREYIGKLSKKELMNLFNKFDFKLTVEEIILTGNYPNKDDLYDYFKEMVDKLSKGLGFDRIEIKVLKKLKTLIPMEYFQLKDYIDHSRDINTTLDEAIEVIKRHELNKRLAKERGYILMVSPRDVTSAKRIVTRYALHITNEQFKKLLDLEVELPRAINMTLAERLEKLGNYNSFYERDMAKETGVVADYFNFIAKNKRRPSYSNMNEEKLASSYDEFLLSTSISKVKVMCASLDYYNIPHSFLEKVLLGEKIKSDEVNAYVEELLDKNMNQQGVSPSELRILKLIYNKQLHKYRVEVSDLIRVQTVIHRINSLINQYENDKEQVNYNMLISFIKINNEYITKDILDRLKDLGITFPKELESMIRSLDGESCIKERKLKEKRKLQNSLEDYVKENKKRPDVGSKLDIEYRKKMARMTKGDIRDYVKIFYMIGIPYTIEEKILLDIMNIDDIDEYLTSLDRKVYVSDYKLDELEKRILSKLNKKNCLTNYPRLQKFLPGYYRQVTVEDKIVNNLEAQIVNNPYKEIDFDAYSLSVSGRRLSKLEAKRMNILINKFFNRVLQKLSKMEKSLKYALDEEEMNTYSIYANYNALAKENVELLEYIKEVDRSYTAIEKAMFKDTLVDEYVEYIKSHNGLRPNLASEDEEEVRLATDYQMVYEYLDRKDILLIEKTIRECEEKSDEDFYSEYIAFILDKGRMPCGNSDDPVEVKLNNLYLSLNGSLTKVQNEEIMKLKKKYSKATMQATINFGKKKG